MSKKTETIELEPSKYSRIESFSASGFSCPCCGGKGGFCEDIGHDRDVFINCDYCNGSGVVNAAITVEWGPDYEV